MKDTNWGNVAESGGQPTKGGYVCKIIAVDDDEKKECLKVYLDFAHGEFEGYYQDLFDRFGFYGLTLFRSYKDTAKGLFKKFLSVLEKSNQGFVADAFNNDPQTLLNLQIGAVLQLRRYTKNSGLDGTQLRVAEICPVGDILAGNFKVPDDLDERNKIEMATVTPSAATAGFIDVPADALEDEGLPFH